MNERIRELAKQARKYVADAIELGFPQDQVDDIRDEKFAELIVRECMACSTWVGKMNNNAIEPVHTAHAINQRIRRQFGVEE